MHANVNRRCVRGFVGSKQIFEKNDPVVENLDSMCDVHTMVAGESNADGPAETSTPHGLDPQVLQLLRDTTEILRATYEGFEAEHDEAGIVRDEDMMYTLLNQTEDVMHLMYGI